MEYWNSGVSQPPSSRRPIGFVWRICSPRWSSLPVRGRLASFERHAARPGLGLFVQLAPVGEGGQWGDGILGWWGISTARQASADWVRLYNRRDGNTAMMEPGEVRRPHGQGMPPAPSFRTSRASPCCLRISSRTQLPISVVRPQRASLKLAASPRVNGRHTPPTRRSQHNKRTYHTCQLPR